MTDGMRPQYQHRANLLRKKFRGRELSGPELRILDLIERRLERAEYLEIFGTQPIKAVTHG